MILHWIKILIGWQWEFTVNKKKKKNNATPMETITVTKIQKGTINEKFDEKYIDCFFF